MNFHSILSLYKKPENKIRIRNVYQLLRRELMKWILRNIFITMGNHIVKYLYFDDIPRISMFSIEIGEHFCARRQLIDISNANFIFWFFIKWKYAMEVHGKIAEILVCAWEICIFNLLLFSLTKMSEMCNHLSLGAKYIHWALCTVFKQFSSIYNKVVPSEIW